MPLTVRDLLYLICVASISTSTVLSNSASAQSSHTIIVSLDTKPDPPPEVFCVIGSQECRGDFCRDLAKLGAAMSIKDDRVSSFDSSTMAVDLKNEPIQRALSLLSRTPRAGCEQCRPTMQLVQDMRTMSATGKIAGFIACASNSHRTHTDRVALTYLNFHTKTDAHATFDVPLEKVELAGDRATIVFAKPIDMNSYESIEAVGGDYLDNTSGLATKELVSMRLNPRCALTPIATPLRQAASDENRSVKIDGGPVDSCIVESNGSTSIWLSQQASENTTKLQVDLTPVGASNPRHSYETSWIGVPPRALKIQVRAVEFGWRKNCLAGSLPAGDDRSWNSACPKATLPQVGGDCTVKDTGATCQYQCSTAPSMPAFDLPTPVHFDRLGKWSEQEVRSAYDWNDVLAYSGQELSSFVPAADRKIIVEFTDPQSWRSQRGNEIDRVELGVDGQHLQSITIGDIAPPWVALNAPNATCASQFSIEVIGARTFAAKKRGLDARPGTSNSLVLASPRDFQDLYHATASIGIGFISPLNDKIGGFRGEPYLSIAAGGELYFARPFSGSVEANVVYEPTYTTYGAVRLMPRADGGTAKVPYHRGAFEIGGSIWGANREWQLGTLGGVGLGGPVFSDVEKVGSIRFFGLGGVFFRDRPTSLHAWIEVFGGLRWGEHHEYFGTDKAGNPIPDTFHGEPALTERALLQAFLVFKWRMVFR